ncbi:MAG: hypothetical protein M3M94_06435, partial [Actinomycetota bacterium]|nr:hypothetical protein [Actinomycetota bacterium]
MLSRRLALVLAVGLAAVAAVGTTPAPAARGMLVGLFDEAGTLSHTSETTFTTFRTLRVQILRVTVYWDQVAKRRPKVITDPDDPAYDWSSYDRVVQLAREHRIKL